MADKTEVTLSTSTQKAVDAIRAPLRAISKDFGAVRERMSEFAPKFMAVARKAMDELGINFVSYIRYLDPSVPLVSKGPSGYGNHRSYYTATNLKRLDDARQRAEEKEKAAKAAAKGGKGGDSAEGIAGVSTGSIRENPMERLATMFKTWEPTMADPKATLAEIVKAFGFSQRQQTRLEKEIAAAQPLFQLSGVKPHSIKITPIKLHKGNKTAAA
jgi:hypothetical protein